ncbi:MAG: Na+/H+ antiporter NhaC family protein, partial [Candidatus Neomarinimicrobiota bacterium]
MKRILTLIFLLALLILMPILASHYTDGWKVWSILPPLVAITLAFVTKNVVISLFIGIFSGAYMIVLQSGSKWTAIIRGFV